MEPDFWLSRWQDSWTPFHSTDINPTLARFWPSLELNATCTVLVPLCGKSIDMWHLSSLGHRVIGVELSPLAVAQFFTEAGVEPEIDAVGPYARYRSGGVTILQGDFMALTAKEAPDVGAWWDRGSLVALPPELRDPYAATLIRVINPGSRGLLASIDYDPAEMEGPPFAITDQEVQRLFGIHIAASRLMSETTDAPPTLAERGLKRCTSEAWRLDARGTDG